MKQAIFKTRLHLKGFSSTPEVSDTAKLSIHNPTAKTKSANSDTSYSDYCFRAKVQKFSAHPTLPPGQIAQYHYRQTRGDFKNSNTDFFIFQPVVYLCSSCPSAGATYGTIYRSVSVLFSTQKIANFKTLENRCRQRLCRRHIHTICPGISVGEGLLFKGRAFGDASE